MFPAENARLPLGPVTLIRLPLRSPIFAWLSMVARGREEDSVWAYFFQPMWHWRVQGETMPGDGIRQSAEIRRFPRWME